MRESVRCTVLSGRKPPQALRASSPKGAPLRNAGNFAATAKSRPLGEGGCERSEQTEGVFLSVKIQARKVRRLSGLVLIKNNFSAEYAQSKRGAHLNRRV